MTEPFFPTTAQVREAYASEPEAEYRDPIGYPEYSKMLGEAFDRWLEARDALYRRGVAEQVRRHCTPSSEAYKAGGDVLIAEVADWIEDTPEWVQPIFKEEKNV